MAENEQPGTSTYPVGDYQRVKRRFGEVRARAFCHATENIERVRQALLNVIGDADVETSAAEGYHGNPIHIPQASALEKGRAETLFERMTTADLRAVLTDLDLRLDSSCALYLRFDKQAAYLGDLKLSTGEDVVAVRIHVLVFPAKMDAAAESAKAFLTELLAKRKST